MEIFPQVNGSSGLNCWHNDRMPSIANDFVKSLCHCGASQLRCLDQMLMADKRRRQLAGDQLSCHSHIMGCHDPNSGRESDVVCARRQYALVYGTQIVG